MFVPYVHALPVAASGERSSVSAGGCPVINFVTDHKTSSFLVAVKPLFLFVTRVGCFFVFLAIGVLIDNKVSRTLTQACCSATTVTYSPTEPTQCPRVGSF